MERLLNHNDTTKDGIYNQLKNILTMNKIKELNNLKINDSIDDKETELECIEDDYARYYEKLEFVKKLDDKWSKYIEMLFKTDNIDDISTTRKIEMMLSYPILFSYFEKIDILSDKELFMIADVAGELDIDDYTFYIQIISDPSVTSSIANSGLDYKEQNKLAKQVMNSMDEFGCEYIGDSEHYAMVENSLNIVSSYVGSKKM